MGFQNILVPYNGSNGAKKGFKTALELASKTKGKITLITCIENQSILPFLKLKSSKQSFKREKELAEKEFASLKKEAEKLEIPFKYVILESSFAPDTITSYTKSKNIDTVIVGKTKFFGTENIYHESMVNYLNLRIECPMVIVR